MSRALDDMIVGLAKVLFSSSRMLIFFRERFAKVCLFQFLFFVCLFFHYGRTAHEEAIGILGLSGSTAPWIDM